MRVYQWKYLNKSTKWYLRLCESLNSLRHRKIKSILINPFMRHKHYYCHCQFGSISVSKWFDGRIRHLFTNLIWSPPIFVVLRWIHLLSWFSRTFPHHFFSLLLWNNVLVVQRSFFFLCWDYLLAVTIWLSLWRVKIKVSKRFSILFFGIDFDLWNILGWIYNRVYKIGSPTKKNRPRFQNIAKSTKKSPWYFTDAAFAHETIILYHTSTIFGAMEKQQQRQWQQHFAFSLAFVVILMSHTICAHVASPIHVDHYWYLSEIFS